MSDNRRPSGFTPPLGYASHGRGAAEDHETLIRRLQSDLVLRNTEIQRLNGEKKDLRARLDVLTVENTQLRERLKQSPLIDMQLLALDRMTESVMIADARGLLVYGNASAARMFGDVAGANVHNVLFDHMLDPYAASKSEDSVVRENPMYFGSRLWKSLSAERNLVRERVRIRMPQTEEAWYDVSFIMQRLEDRNGHPWALIEVLDIGSLNRDELTGLFRREVAINAIQREIGMGRVITDGVERRGQAARPLSVIFCDIDDFKSINETYGYAAGNRVIRKFAETLKGYVRPFDLVSRWFSGDEFLPVIYAEEEVARQIADRMCLAIKALRVTLKLEGNREATIGVTASFGVASYEEGDDWKTLTERAEKNAKHSKQGGKGRVTGRMTQLIRPL